MARQSRALPMLLTRPSAQSARFAAQVTARFGPVQIFISPLMAPEYQAPALPAQQPAGIILSSETGAEAARRIFADAGLSPNLPAFCVGDLTADAARAAGFLAHSAKGNAATLTAYLVGQNITGPLWHIHGFDTRGDIAQTLTLGGLVTFSVPAYRQIPASLSPEAVALLAQDAPLIVPLFSPNSARLFVAEYQKIASKAPLWIAALSEAVLRETMGIPTAKHVVAAQPNAQEMLLSLSPWLDDDSYP